MLYRIIYDYIALTKLYKSYIRDYISATRSLIVAASFI